MHRSTGKSEHCVVKVYGVFFFLFGFSPIRRPNAPSQQTENHLCRLGGKPVEVGRVEMDGSFSCIWEHLSQLGLIRWKMPSTLPSTCLSAGKLPRSRSSCPPWCNAPASQPPWTPAPRSEGPSDGETLCCLKRGVLEVEARKSRKACKVDGDIYKRRHCKQTMTSKTSHMRLDMSCTMEGQWTHMPHHRFAWWKGGTAVIRCN